MTRTARLLAAALVVAALLLQPTVVARLPLPGSPPDLVLVVVLALALLDGPRTGVVAGFLAGTAADLLSGHEAGRLALSYAVVGCLAGLVERAPERSVLLPATVVAAAGGGAVLLYAGQGLLLGDPAVTAAALAGGLLGAALGAVLLTPLVVPVVRLVLRPERGPLATAGGSRG